MYKTVFHRGKYPNDVMIVGEKPGKEEAYRGLPFVGRSGDEQRFHLNRNNLDDRHFYVTNIDKDYEEGNPDPSPEQIEKWTEFLLEEVKECQPKLIIAVGRFAAKFFLGRAATMEMCHGLPHKPGCFDHELANRSCGAVVLPIYHPAAGFHNERLRPIIGWDYEQVGKIYRAVNGGYYNVLERYATYNGSTVLESTYSSTDMDNGYGGLLSGEPINVIAIDTEGWTADPWSLQYATSPGTGYVHRYAPESPDYGLGIDLLQDVIDDGALVVMHNAMHDIAVCRAMGLDVRSNVFDTMYAAYLLRHEPQGLKLLAWRWCGMRMRSFAQLIRGAATNRQINYLRRVVEYGYGKPEPVQVTENDGSTSVYRPSSPSKKAAKIISDLESGKVDKDGKPIDPYLRWNTDGGTKSRREVLSGIRSQVAFDLGPMPEPSLDDVDYAEAIKYAGMDADATLRLYQAILPELVRRGHLSHAR